jgi:hypothetical protein
MYKPLTQARCKSNPFTRPSARSLDLDTACVAKDRPFNGFRVARSLSAKTVADDVRNQVQNYEMKMIRSRARREKDQINFVRQIESIVCDLVHREITKPGAWVAITFSKVVLGQKDRYRAKVLSENLPVLVQHMATPEMEFVEVIKGARNPFDPSLSRQTVIRAGKRLRDRIEEYRLTLDDLGLDQTQELIILKDTKQDLWDKGKWLQYPDTDQTIRYRQELTHINDWLEQADLEFIPYGVTSTKFDSSDRRLRRYFNNNSFEHGGRLFGGFWQNMKKDMRKDIVIDGMDTVTLDYGQMIARVLYGHAGKPFEFQDAYSVPGLEGCRSGVKKVFSAMLYSDTPLKRMPQGCRGLFPLKFTYADVAEKIIQHHHQVADLLHAGIGPALTYQESNILISVLTKLIDLGITALPLHDAVIVADEHEEQTRSIMLSVFREVVGIKAIISSE